MWGQTNSSTSVRMCRCVFGRRARLAVCVCVKRRLECEATAVLQISAHLLVTESLKLAHLIKQGARGQTALTPLALITHAAADANTQSHHPSRAWLRARLFICASIIRRVMTTPRQRWIFAKSTAVVNGAALCFMISARRTVPSWFFQFGRISLNTKRFLIILLLF